MISKKVQQRVTNGDQGRIQDLSEGGGQDFSGTKKFVIRAAGENLFYLKDSKRVKINDLETIKRLFRNKERK